jgi:hypothetical protein
MFLCDSIVKEYEDLLTLVCRVKVRMREYVLQTSQELTSLAEFMAQNRPRFEAASFFTIDKSMLFSILYVIVTFLLVIIQFKINM